MAAVGSCERGGPAVPRTTSVDGAATRPPLPASVAALIQANGLPNHEESGASGRSQTSTPGAIRSGGNPRMLQEQDARDG